MITELERAAIGAADINAATLTLPTAICIGAGRSGSTSLNAALSQHPEIFVCSKEPDHFSRDENGCLPPWFHPDKDAIVPRTLTEYSRLFEAGANKTVRLDTSVSYMHGPVAERIAKAIPDARIVAILRHPIDQARSWAEVMLGHPPSTNELHLLLGCEDEIDGQLPLREHGQYHKHLGPYFDNFPARQIWVRTFEHLTASLHREQALFDLQLFLGVKPIDLELPHWNRSGAALPIPGGVKALAKRTLPDRAVRWLSRVQHRLQDRHAPPQPAEALPPWFRDEMMACWYPDVVPGLDKLGFDVSAWR